MMSPQDWLFIRTTMDLLCLMLENLFKSAIYQNESLIINKLVISGIHWDAWSLLSFPGRTVQFGIAQYAPHSFHVVTIDTRSFWSVIHQRHSSSMDPHQWNYFFRPTESRSVATWYMSRKYAAQYHHYCFRDFFRHSDLLPLFSWTLSEAILLAHKMASASDQRPHKW